MACELYSTQTILKSLSDPSTCVLRLQHIHISVVATAILLLSHALQHSTCAIQPTDTKSPLVHKSCILAPAKSLLPQPKFPLRSELIQPCLSWQPHSETDCCRTGAHDVTLRSHLHRDIYQHQPAVHTSPYEAGVAAIKAAEFSVLT